MDYADSDSEDIGVNVPKKVVISSKTTMSLHERFSNLPAPKKVKKAAPITVKKSTSATSTSRFVEPDFDNFMEEDAYDPEDAIFDLPVQKAAQNGRNPHFRAPLARRGRGAPLRSRGVPRQYIRQAPVVIQEVQVPIEERLTLPKVVYVQTTPRGQYRGNRGRGNFNAFRGSNNKFQINRGQNTFKKSFAPHQRGALRGNSRGRGQPAFKKPIHNQPKKSADEMDREIDEYMKGGKHPRIAF